MTKFYESTGNQEHQHRLQGVSSGCRRPVCAVLRGGPQRVSPRGGLRAATCDVFFLRSRCRRCFCSVQLASLPGFNRFFRRFFSIAGGMMDNRSGLGSTLDEYPVPPPLLLLRGPASFQGRSVLHGDVLPSARRTAAELGAPLLGGRSTSS